MELGYYHGSLLIQADSEVKCLPHASLTSNYCRNIDLISDNRPCFPINILSVVGMRWTKYLGLLLVLVSLLLPCRAAQTELSYRVTEELPIGSFVADVKEDANLLLKYDGDTLKQFHYQFLTEPPTNFAIGNTSGVISTNGRINRDELCPNEVKCTVQLDVAIRPVQFFQIIKVTVNILDLNDNTPLFEDDLISHFMFESASVGSGFAVPTATDPDSPEFTVIAYELMSEAANFELKVTEKVNGAKEVRLVLTERLDRETLSLYEMQIVAFDGGIPSKSGSVEVRISVGDANDNSPVFERSVYEVSVKENIPVHTLLLTVSATDPDEGTNGQVQYEFSEQTKRQYGQLFAIGKETGDITVEATIDYEKESVFNLGVNARDMGLDSTPGDATLIVRVEDVNDHAPQITVNTLLATGTTEAKLPEDSPPDTFVAHLTVRDPDIGTNGEFTCSLSETFFRLERIYATEYSIFTAAGLDREKQTGYNLALVCKDKGTPPQVAIQHINVTITDVNDNTPVFLRDSYSAELLENNYFGAFLVQVNASDADSGENARLEYIIDGEEAMYFTVDQRSGVVTARAALDREQRDLYNFWIIARDEGHPSRSASAQLTVRVLDVNDERPRFSVPEYSFAVSEGLPAGEEVGTVWADDADGTPYNAFTFSLFASESLSNAFYINPRDGRISTTRVLDREQQATYRLLVVATDVTTPSMSSTSTVTVHVMDINDNDPVFQFPNKKNNTVFISNQVPVGYIVTKITAVDNDIGNNSNLYYEISHGNRDKYFSLEPGTGAVYLERDVTSVRNRTFNILVAVMDQGNPQRLSSSDLYIVVDSTVTFADYHNKEALLSGYNFVIVIAIACVGGVIIVILLLAIMIVIRKQKHRRGRGHTYNCRMEALKSLTAKEDYALKNGKNGGTASKHGNEQTTCTSSVENNFPVPAVKPRQDYKKGGLNNQGDMSYKGNLNKMDLSHEKSRQWLATLEPPDYQQHLAHLRDADVSSIHSGDASNTDSGRGSSETGESAQGTRLEAHQAGFLYGLTGAVQNKNVSMILQTRPFHNSASNSRDSSAYHGRTPLTTFRSDSGPEKFTKIASNVCPNPNPYESPCPNVSQTRDHNGYAPLGQSSPGDYHGGTRYAHALSSSGYSTNSSICNAEITPKNDRHNESFFSDDDATTIAGSYVVDERDYKQCVSQENIEVM